MGRGGERGMECGWNEREEEELSLALICTDSQHRGRGRKEEGRGKSGRRRMVPRRTSELILRLIIDQRTAMTQRQPPARVPGRPSFSTFHVHI